MENNGTDRQRPTGPFRRAAVYAAALFGAAGVGGLWLVLAHGGRVHMLLALSAFAPAALVGTLWGFRARARQRWQAALDAYADREIARYRPGKPRRKKRLRPSAKVLRRSSGLRNIQGSRAVQGLSEPG